MRIAVSPPGPCHDLHIIDEGVQGPRGMIPIRRYAPSGAVGTTLWLHGGGWTLGGIDNDDALCRDIARLSRTEVVSVDYRLAPEHPFPAGLDDAWAVFESLGEDRRSGRPPGLAGSSAGANLALCMALRARDHEGLQPAFLVLVHPPVDARCATPSFERLAQAWPLSADLMRWFWKGYSPDPAVRISPDVSPALAERMDGLPPTLLVSAGFDVLIDEIEALEARLHAEGVPCVHDRNPKLPHAFLSVGQGLVTSSGVLERIAKYVLHRGTQNAEDTPRRS